MTSKSHFLSLGLGKKRLYLQKYFVLKPNLSLNMQSCRSPSSSLQTETEGGVPPGLEPGRTMKTLRYLLKSYRA
jgi:hypothetical protein